jgi:hypothetical protein
MPRRVQDIVPSDRRSIRDISISREKSSISHPRPEIGRVEKKTSRTKEEIPVKIHKIEEKTMSVGRQEEVSVKEPMHRMTMTPPVPKRRASRRKGLWLIVTLGIIVVIVVAAFIASTYFSRAVFTITPKVIPVTLSSTLVIKPGVTNDLTYEVITMKSSESATVPATDGPSVSVKAEGKINIYNAYSPSSIRLIAGTRLSDDSGRVYRLKSSVVIPGFTKPGGGVIPGTVSTNIIADQPGLSYNISQSDSISDFKIVAYKGSAKYDTVYARLTSDVSGGAIGTKKIVSANVLASSTAALKTKILTSLLQKIKSSVPAEYIMYDSSYSSSFSTATVDGTDKSQATVTLQGTVYGIIFKRSSLIAKLAGSQAVSTFGNLGFTSPGLGELNFSITNMKDFAPDKKGTLIVNIKGTMKLVGIVPVDELKKDMAGKSLAESQDVLKTYAPVIETADGELVPPWSKIPSNVDRITINVKEGI